MFNVGFSEMILIAVIALIFIGPKELPEVARMLGRFINDLRRASSGITDEIKDQVQRSFEESKTPEKPSVSIDAQEKPTEEKNETDS